MEIFGALESEVRSYCRHFPVVFNKAKDVFLYDVDGKQYLDFFSGAGSLNYGHNNPAIKQAVMDYLLADGVIHSLDMATLAKQQFLETFEAMILKPRRLNYKLQFTGPTGANAAEAALKLAKLVKKRTNILAFTNAYHGLSSGALAVTANRHYRSEAFINRTNAAFMPFDGYFGPEVDTIAYLRRFLTDHSSGVDWPAAVIVETVQAEGGVNIARPEWLQQLAQLCQEFDMVLIVDDIQVGCGRTGAFFSFEQAGITPDIVLLSKSISGFGLPMSLLLLKPELDCWKPGEHTGTFRGNNLAFVAAAETLRSYWKTDALSESLRRKNQVLAAGLEDILRRHPSLDARVRGKGFIYGVDIAQPATARAIADEAFRQGLILERCGAQGHVLKLLPPLVIDESTLQEGLNMLERSIALITA